MSQEDWVMAGRAEYPMLLPAVKYQYTLLDRRGVLTTVGVVTAANVSTAPVLKQVNVVAFLAPMKTKGPVHPVVICAGVDREPYVIGKAVQGVHPWEVRTSMGRL